MSPTTRARVARLVAVAAGALTLVTTSPSSAQAGQTTTDGQGVLLAGIGGLRWDDLSPSTTPTLWDLAENGAMGSLSVRTVHPVSCPMDGWLTLNAGVRATTVEQGPGDGGECRTVDVVPAEDGTATVPAMDDLRALNEEYDNDPSWGLLGREATREGACTTAVGPGAAVALADARGRVDAYVPAVADADATDLDRCALTVVDLGTLPPDGDARTRAVRDADAALGRLLDLAPNGITPLVAGVSDDSATPHLHVALAGGERFPDGWLTAGSTRYPGMVQLTDLTPTALHLVGTRPLPDEAVGSVWETTDGRPPDLGAAVSAQIDEDTKAQVVRDVVPWFLAAVALLQLAAYAALALLRRTGARTLHLGKAGIATALFFGAVPAATFLANLLPWWGAGHPAAVLVALVCAAALAVAGLAVAGPWRRSVLGPVGVVGGVTAVVLATDVMTGSRLQMSSLMGHSPLVAGRFYGFGNVAFAVFAAAAMLAAAAAAGPLLQTGRRRQATAVAGAIGATAVIVDGWPAWGSDFGGVLALVPATGVLVLLVAGVGVTLVRAVLIGLTAVLTVSVVTFLDWLSPPADRSHLGDFAEALSEGTGWPVIARKAAAATRSLTGSPLALLVPVALFAVAMLVARPARLRASALAHAYTVTPALRAGLVSVVVAGVVGFTTNDSGIIVPAVTLLVAVPLGVAATLAARPRQDADPAVGLPNSTRTDPPPRGEPAGAATEDS